MSAHSETPTEHETFAGHPGISLSEITDAEYDELLPQWLQRLSSTHWTPAAVARGAARWLAREPGVRILDLGCGPGKFCLLGASVTRGFFTGIEQRSRLAEIARQMAHQCGLDNVRIIHGNVMDISFDNYDAFYLFNPFQENVFPNLMIDDEVSLEPRLYQQYQEFVKEQLASRPVGTKVVTFHGDEEDVPSCYTYKEVAFDGKLKLWVKNG